jgi:hypothetical protein
LNLTGHLNKKTRQRTLKVLHRQVDPLIPRAAIAVPLKRPTFMNWQRDASSTISPNASIDAFMIMV